MAINYISDNTISAMSYQGQTFAVSDEDITRNTQRVNVVALAAGDYDPLNPPPLDTIENITGPDLSYMLPTGGIGSLYVDGITITGSGTKDDPLKSAGSIAVADDHIFADEAERDAYFAANPDQLVDRMFVVTDGVLQQYNGGEWIDASIAIQGPPGEDGEPNVLSIGTVTTGATSSATITGTAPNQTLNLVLQKGEDGAPNTLTIGTVSSGDTPSATITGTAPNQVLNLVMEKGDQGEPGVTPSINATNKHWMIGSTDTGVLAEGADGDDGVTPSIGANNNWWIGTTDTGIKAKAAELTIGANGNWYIDGVDTTKPSKGADGEDGTVVTLSAENTWVLDGVDTLVKAKGSVVTIDATSKNWYIDGVDTGVKATGADGITPHIGDNGHWYIGTEDTGVNAEGSITNQEQADWTQTNTSSPAYIKNKPTIPTDLSGFTNTGADPYVTESDLAELEQVQADWAVSLATDPAFIKNKPTLPADLNDLTNTSADPYVRESDLEDLEVEQVQADWNVNDNTSKAYIANKPTLPTDLDDLTNTGSDPFVQQSDLDVLDEPVQSDWNEVDTSSLAYIANKPTIPTVPTDLSGFTNTGADPYVKESDLEDLDLVQEQADWSVSDTSSDAYIKNKPTDLEDFTNTGDDPYAQMSDLIAARVDQVPANWTETDSTKPSYILNKPTLPEDLDDLTNTSTDPFVRESDLEDLDIEQIQASWTETDTTSKAYIQNKPTLPTDLDDLTNTGSDPYAHLSDLDDLGVDISADPSNIISKKMDGIYAQQVQSDWNQFITSYPDYIKNKPTIPEDLADLDNKSIDPFIRESDMTTALEDFITEVMADEITITGNGLESNKLRLTDDFMERFETLWDKVFSEEPTPVPAITAPNVPANGQSLPTTATGTGWTADVSWSPNHTTVQGQTIYTATYTLTAGTGYDFGDEGPDITLPSGATGGVWNSADNSFTVTYPETPEDLIPITSLTIDGIKPVKGETPDTIVSGTGWTGSIVWQPNDAEFAPNTIYKATITLTPASGYTLNTLTNAGITVVDETSHTYTTGTKTIVVIYPVTEPESSETEWVSYYTLPDDGSFPVAAFTFADTVPMSNFPGWDELDPAQKPDAMTMLMDPVEAARMNLYFTVAGTNGGKFLEPGERVPSQFLGEGDPIEINRVNQWAYDNNNLMVSGATAGYPVPLKLVIDLKEI